MIRQAISCDICGSEKRQTNHWFVATEDGGELRVTGWGSRKRLRPETKHLCGQTCLHKLLDEFVARSIAGQHTQAAEATAKNDASLTAVALPRVPLQSSAVSHQPDAPAVKATPVSSARPVIVSPVVLPLPVRTAEVLPPPQHVPRYSRAEAWERERERTQARGEVARPHKRF